MEAGYGATSASEDDFGKKGPGPQEWQPFASLEGTALLETQGFEEWTTEENSLWREGKLTSKWGIGQVTVRWPIQDQWDFLAIVYGFVPVCVPIWWVIWLLVGFVRTGYLPAFPFFGLCVSLSFVAVTEFAVKPICKCFISEAKTRRPLGSVCKAAGLPSGHTMNAYTLMTWIILEVLYDSVIYPEWFIVTLVVMAPVPWARVHTQDHTLLQVSTSMALAICMGVIAYHLRTLLFPRIQEPWQWVHMPGGISSPLH